MNDTQLERRINSIGKRCFVEYFEHFADESISRSVLIELMYSKEKWSTCGNRISSARSIIKAGRARDALQIISCAKKVSKAIRDEARRLHDHYPDIVGKRQP